MNRCLVSLLAAGGLMYGPPGGAAEVRGGPDVSTILCTEQEGGSKTKTIQFKSKHIGASRTVTVWTSPGHDPRKRNPVVYAADGMSNVNIGNIAPLIREGRIPPVIIIGTMYGDGMRQKEYRPQESPKDFDAHEKWIYDELLPWAEKEYGAATDRRDRVVYGSSNGGPWALTMASRHPDLFGNVFAMMVYGLAHSAWQNEMKPQAKDPTRFILVAGTQDDTGVKENAAIEKYLREKRFPVSSHVKEGEGHTHELNQKMLPIMLEEAFGRPRPKKEPGSAEKLWNSVHDLNCARGGHCLGDEKKVCDRVAATFKAGLAAGATKGKAEGLTCGECAKNKDAGPCDKCRDALFEILLAWLKSQLEAKATKHTLTKSDGKQESIKCTFTTGVVCKGCVEEMSEAMIKGLKDAASKDKEGGDKKQPSPARR